MARCLYYQKDAKNTKAVYENGKSLFYLCMQYIGGMPSIPYGSRGK
jgi:hypothetical protein